MLYTVNWGGKLLSLWQTHDGWVLEGFLFYLSVFVCLHGWYLYMPMHVCVGVHMHVSTHLCEFMSRPEVDIRCLPQSFSTLVIEPRPLSWTPSLLVGLVSWSIASLLSLLSKCWTHRWTPSIYMGSGDLNSGSYANRVIRLLVMLPWHRKDIFLFQSVEMTFTSYTHPFCSRWKREKMRNRMSSWLKS